MVYCHECGFQVAEIDSFCPNCGIALQPVAVAPEPEKTVDDSLEKTFVGSQIDLTQTENAKPPVAAVNEIDANAETSVTAEPIDIPSADVINDKVSELPENKISSETARNPVQISESIDIPATTTQKTDISAEDENFAVPSDISLEDDKELQIEDFADEEDAETDWAKFGLSDADEAEADNLDLDDLDEEPNESELANEPVFKSSTGKIPAQKAEEIIKNQNSDSLNESSMMSYQETEIKEKLEVEEVEPAKKDDSKSDSGELEFDDTLSYMPEIPASEPDEQSEIDTIKPPNTEFDKTDSTSVKSESAALIEDQNVQPEEIRQIKPEEQIEFKQTESAKIELEQAREIESSQNSGEAHPSTRQNLSDKDTGGKNSGKLKPLDEGTILNERYEIVRKIGGGGMGAVYLASDKNLGGVMRAVKEMVQSYIEAEQQEKAVQDFKRESMLLTSLEHHGIPTIYDYFYDEKEARFYLVMKYIAGGDLAARLRSAPEGRIDEKTVTEWGIQIAEVLEYLHNRQPPIVYRDLKPANVMIDSNSGRVMLIDFGIARWVNKEEKGVTAVGTMGYAPPELFSGNVEPRSDIYSLGSTMFHLLTGADPQSNPLLIFDFQKNPKPRQINSQISDQMEKILMRTVEYNAGKRFGSAAELKNALQKHLEELESGKISYGISKSPNAIAFSEEPVFCGFCGQKIVATDLFCAFCGAKQPIAQKGVHSENYAKQTLTAKLLILGTSELEMPSFRLDKDDNLVGRRDPVSNIFPEVDLSKFDPQTKISRKHARIWRDGKNYILEDLGSSNGTMILPVISDNVRLMPNQPHVLSNGDKIKIGDTTLHFVLS